MSEICFNCDQPATTTDHIPPQVFFPELKDLPAGEDLRKQLLTAPCCPSCNHGSSKDDEYVACLIATYIGNNDTATNHVASKVLRALKHSEGLKGRLMHSSASVTVNGQNSRALIVDYDALTKVMTRIARGLYRRRNADRLTAPLTVISPMTFNPKHGDRVGLIQSIAKALGQLDWTEGPGCENPEVFRYKHAMDGELHLLKFYEGFEVLVAPSLTHA